MEGRVEDVLKKYSGKISPEVVNKFVEAQNAIDPAINNKYLDWMVMEYINGSDANKIIDAIDIWYKNVSKIDAELISDRYPEFIESAELQRIIKNPKDINSYKTIELLVQIGKDAQKKLSRIEEDKIIQSETRLVYQDNQYQIRVPLTHRSSCKYGRGTAWCTRLPDNDSHFKTYTRDGILFYISDKTMPSRADHPLYKVAVYMKKDGNDIEIYNARDEKIGSDLKHFFPPEMIAAMNKYREKYVIDMSKLGKKISAMVGSIGGDIDGWELDTDNNKSFLFKHQYVIYMDFDMKENVIDFELRTENKNVASTTMTIPVNQMKMIEDIVIDHGGDENMLMGWIQQMVDNIRDNWNLIIDKFQPVIVAIETHLEIVKQINKVTGNWKFTTETFPSDNNHKSSFKSSRTVPVEGKNVTYTFILVLDLMKNQFVFKSEEDLGKNQKEQFEDQISAFDKNLMSNPKQLIKEFLSWAKEIVEMAYDEDWATRSQEEDIKALKKLPGKYSSTKFGTFTVELDAENKLHIYSEQMGTHYAIDNANVFINKFIDKYGLKKVR